MRELVKSKGAARGRRMLPPARGRPQRVRAAGARDQARAARRDLLDGGRGIHHLPLPGLSRPRPQSEDRAIASLTTTEAEIRDMGCDVGEGHYTAAPYFQGVETTATAISGALSQALGDDEPTNMCLEASYFQVNVFAKCLEQTNSLDTRILRGLRSWGRVRRAAGQHRDQTGLGACRCLDAHWPGQPQGTFRHRVRIRRQRARRSY